MIIVGVLALLATLANARGVWLALHDNLKASTWFALGAALLFGLSMQFPDAFEVTATLLTLAVVDLSAAGSLVFREMALRRDQRLSLEVADDAVVRELRHEVDEDEARRRLAGSGEAE